MEYLFKAWDIKNKCWLTDKENVYLSEEGEAFILVRGAASDYLSRVDVIICYWTGKTDKNGKRIFCGDRNKGGGVVVWNEDDASFCWDYSGELLYAMVREKDWCEITGTIHD